MSRRLQNASTNRVDFRGFLRTSVETTSGAKRSRLYELAPEVVRHQKVKKRATFESTPAAPNTLYLIESKRNFLEAAEIKPPQREDSQIVEEILGGLWAADPQDALRKFIGRKSRSSHRNLSEMPSGRN